MLIEQVNTLKSDLAREKLEYIKIVEAYELELDSKMNQFQLKITEISETYTDEL